MLEGQIFGAFLANGELADKSLGLTDSSEMRVLPPNAYTRRVMMVGYLSACQWRAIVRYPS